jgi:hypothetical protein
VLLVWCCALPCGLLPSLSSFAQRIKIDFEKYGKLIQATGMKID